MATGLELKRLREAANMSAAKFAALIGVDAGRLRKWEEKDFEPRDEDAEAICKYFGITELSALKKIDKLPKTSNGKPIPEAPRDGQRLGDVEIKESPTLLEVLIRAEGDRAKAEVDRAKADHERAIADRTIAETNKLLATMLKDNGSTASQASLDHEVSKMDNMIAGVIKILADQQKRGFEDFENEVYKAGGEILQSYKTGILIEADKVNS